MNSSPPSEADLPTIFDPVNLVRKGLCPVTKIRHSEGPLESHSLYYEQHGTGKEKIVFIMGYAHSAFAVVDSLDGFTPCTQFEQHFLRLGEPGRTF